MRSALVALLVRAAPCGVLAGVCACGGGGNGGASGTGGGDARDAAADAAHIDPRDASTSDAGQLDAGGVVDTEDAATPAPRPTGFTTMSGGVVGTSDRFRVVVGVGAPVAIARGEGQRFVVRLGNPAVTKGD